MGREWPELCYQQRQSRPAFALTWAYITLSMVVSGTDHTAEFCWVAIAFKWMERTKPGTLPSFLELRRNPPANWEMQFCEIWHSFSRTPMRNFLWCYYRRLITSLALENCKKKNAVFFKLFWYKVFLHWEIKLLIFLEDSVLTMVFKESWDR